MACKWPRGRVKKRTVKKGTARSVPDGITSRDQPHALVERIGFPFFNEISGEIDGTTKPDGPAAVEPRPHPQELRLELIGLRTAVRVPFGTSGLIQRTTLENREAGASILACNAPGCLDTAWFTMHETHFASQSTGDNGRVEIYLLRHGVADDRASTGRDADRRLTEEGRDKLRRVLERAHGAGVQPSLILSSPLKRAIETAEIAARELGYEGKILRTDALLPGSSPQAVWEEIRRHRDESAILLSGHEPLFSATVAWMLGSTRAMIEFRKGALVRIDVESPGPVPAGVLQWMITRKTA